MSKWNVNEMDGEFAEYRVSKGNVIDKDIVIGSLLYFLRDVFDLYKFVVDILEGMFVSTSAPVVGCPKQRPFLLDFL